MSIEALDDWPGTDDKDRLREWLALTYTHLGARQLDGIASKMDNDVSTAMMLYGLELIRALDRGIVVSLDDVGETMKARIKIEKPIKKPDITSIFMMVKNRKLF